MGQTWLMCICPPLTHSIQRKTRSIYRIYYWHLPGPDLSCLTVNRSITNTTMMTLTRKPSRAGSMTMNSPTKSKYIMWPWRYSAGSASNGESTIALTTASKLSPAAYYIAPAYYNNYCVSHYITLETIYSGLSKSNLNAQYGDAATE